MRMVALTDVELSDEPFLLPSFDYPVEYKTAHFNSAKDFDCTNVG